MSVKKDVSEKKVFGSKKDIDAKLKEMGWDLSQDIEPVSGKSRLDLPADLKKELDEAGLVPRFLNRRIFNDIGFHKSGWKPYKFETKGNYPNMQPDGTYISQDLILGVKPKVIQDAHRKQIAKKNEGLASVSKIQAKQIKEQAKEAGLSAEIHEGYEEN